MHVSPSRYWLVVHVGLAVHWYPLVVLEHAPVRCWSGLHWRLLHLRQLPLLLAPGRMYRYSSVLHVGWRAHVHPLVLPAHVPMR